jgi:mRNA interferase HicA
LPSATLEKVSTIAYDWKVKVSELKRRLEQQGCTVEQGTNHWVIRLGGKRTTIPRHPSQEIKSGTYHSILRQLGLKRK